MTDEFQLAVGRTGLLLIAASTLTVGVVGGRRVGVATGLVAGLTWFAGTASAFLASAHLAGVLCSAAYVHTSFSWNFRFASLLLVGIWLIIGAASASLLRARFFAVAPSTGAGQQAAHFCCFSLPHPSFPYSRSWQAGS